MLFPWFSPAWLACPVSGFDQRLLAEHSEIESPWSLCHCRFCEKRLVHQQVNGPICEWNRSGVCHDNCDGDGTDVFLVHPCTQSARITSPLVGADASTADLHFNELSTAEYSLYTARRAAAALPRPRGGSLQPCVARRAVRRSLCRKHSYAPPGLVHS